MQSLNTENKRDLSVSMLRANVLALFIMIPVAVLQFSLFTLWNGEGEVSVTLNLLNLSVFMLIVIASIVVHEFIHGLAWVVFGNMPFSAVQFGVQWNALTPFAHLKEPIEVNVYRIGGFMPGFILGILPFVLSIFLRSGGLLWFGVLQTAAASGDWLILWLLRNVKRGTLVEDHPSKAGCYVYESDALLP